MFCTSAVPYVSELMSSIMNTHKCQSPVSIRHHVTHRRSLTAATDLCRGCHSNAGIINQTHPVVFCVFQRIPSRCIRFQALRLTTYLGAPPTRTVGNRGNTRYTVHFMEYQVSFRRTHPGLYVRKLS